MGGSGGETGNQYSMSMPWAPTMNPLKEMIPELTAWYKETDPLSLIYPGERVADFTPAQLQAQQMATQNATDVNPMRTEVDRIMAEYLAQTDLTGKNAASPANLGYRTTSAPPAVYLSGAGRGGEWGGGEGQSEMEKILSGYYLNTQTNPYLEGMVNTQISPVMQNFLTQTIPSLNTSAVQAGRYGSGAWSGLLGQAGANTQKNIGDIAANIYGQNYQSERDRMLQALGLRNQYNIAQMNAQTAGASAAGTNAIRQAELEMQRKQNEFSNFYNIAQNLIPTQEQMGWNDISQLAQTGLTQQQQNQKEIDSLMQVFSENANAPYNQMINYLNPLLSIAGQGGGKLSGAVGGSGGGSGLVGGLGGAASGAMLGSEISPGWGTAIGGLLGGLIGLFSD